MCVRAKLLQSCLTLCNPMDCSLPCSSIHGILQARILEWVAMPSSRGSSQPRDWTHISGIAGGFLTTEPSGEARLMYSSPIHNFIYFNALCLQRNPLSSCNRWKVVFKENNLIVIMIFFILFYFYIYLSPLDYLRYNSHTIKFNILKYGIQFFFSILAKLYNHLHYWTAEYFHHYPLRKKLYIYICTPISTPHSLLPPGPGNH